MAIRKTSKKRRSHRKRGVHKIRVKRHLAVTKTHIFKRTSDLFSSTNFNWSSGGGNGQGTTQTADGFLLGTGALGVSNFTYYSYACALTLDLFPDYTEFTKLFDQYKVLSMTLTFKPIQRVSLTATTGNQCCGAIHYSVIDYDDQVLHTPSNVGVQELRQKSGFREVDYFRNFKRTCVPRQAMAAYNTSALFSSYANMKSQWCDAASPNILHFGFKGIIEVFAPNFSVATDLWFRPELTVYLACRDVQ